MSARPADGAGPGRDSRASAPAAGAGRGLGRTAHPCGESYTEIGSDSRPADRGLLPPESRKSRRLLTTASPVRISFRDLLFQYGKRRSLNEIRTGDAVVNNRRLFLDSGG